MELMPLGTPWQPVIQLRHRRGWDPQRRTACWWRAGPRLKPGVAVSTQAQQDSPFMTKLKLLRSPRRAQTRVTY